METVLQVLDRKHAIIMCHTLVRELGTNHHEMI